MQFYDTSDREVSLIKKLFLTDIQVVAQSWNILVNLRKIPQNLLLMLCKKYNSAHVKITWSSILC